MHAYEYRVFNNHKDQKNLRTPLADVYIYIYTRRFLRACYWMAKVNCVKLLRLYETRVAREITDAYYLHHLHR